MPISVPTLEPVYQGTPLIPCNPVGLVVSDTRRRVLLPLPQHHEGARVWVRLAFDLCSVGLLDRTRGLPQLFHERA